MDCWFEGTLLRRFGHPGAPKVICVHGFADDGTAFAPLANSVLTDDFELIAVDLPGFGVAASTPDPAIELSARFIIRLAETLSPDRSVALIGHSIGSAIVVAAATLFPTRIAAVLSIEGNLTADDAYFSGRAADYNDAAAFKQDFVHDLERLATEQPQMERYLSAVRQADAYAMWTLGRDAVERGQDNAFGHALLSLPDKGIATTYLWGRHNTPPVTAEFVDAHLAASRVQVIEFKTSGHWKSVDAPKATGRIAREAFGTAA